MPSPTDSALVAACLAGDEEAWVTLVERYGPLILSIPRRYGLRAGPAEDVFAEVCAVLVKSLRSLRDPVALPQWIIRTTTRLTWEVARKARVVPPEDLPPLTGAAPPDAVVEKFEAEQMVRTALAEASDKCRRLLEMLYFAVPTPSYDDIAAALGVPRGSLGPTRRRCLDKLRARLGPALGGDVSAARPRPPDS